MPWLTMAMRKPPAPVAPDPAQVVQANATAALQLDATTQRGQRKRIPGMRLGNDSTDTLAPSRTSALTTSQPWLPRARVPGSRSLGGG